MRFAKGPREHVARLRCLSGWPAKSSRVFEPLFWPDQLVQPWEHGVTVDHFKAEADVDAARYIFRIEVRVTPAIDVCRSFVRSVDASLGRINLEYAAKRKSLRLEPPVLEVMRPGWYEARKQCLLADGKRDFQAKTMLLSIREEKEQASGTKAGLIEKDFVVTTVTMDG